MNDSSATRIQKPISILLAAVDPVLISNLQSFLESQHQMRLMDTVEHSQDCLAKLNMWIPDVLLLEESMLEGGASMLSRFVAEKYPRTAIFVITEASAYTDENYRQLMRAGVDDLFRATDPPSQWLPSIGDVVDRKRKMELDGRSTLGKVITVHSLKGGVGCTTIAANLALTLAEDKSVLLIDLNWPFGDVATLLNLTPIRSSLDLLPVMDNLTQQRIKDATTGDFKNLAVLTAPLHTEHQEFLKDLMEEDLLRSEFEATNQLLNNILDSKAALNGSLDEKAQNVMEYILRKAKAKQALMLLVRQLLLSTPRYYDYIVLDLPPAIDELTLSALRRGDVNILVCTPDIISVRNLRNELNLLSGFNIQRSRQRLVVNRAKRNDDIKPVDIRAIFDEWEWLPPIQEDPKLQALVNASLPPAAESNKIPFALAIEKMAQSLTPILTQSGQAIAKGRLR